MKKVILLHGEAMKAYSITPKGQVTIPLEIRERLKLKPGDKVIYQSTKNGIMLKPVKRNMLGDFGFLKAKQRAGADLDTVRESVRKRIATRARTSK